MPVTKHAPAKINLNLHITGRRPDGYHTLDSFMVFTEWGDTVTVTESNEPSMSVTGTRADIIHGDLLSMDRTSPNLIIRALHAMGDACGKAPNIHIDLVKEIPSGAGLGGGSSDAAATMLALNELWGYPLTMTQLCDIGLTLGAELPVCLAQKPSRVQGIGDIVKPLRDVPTYPIVIVWPDKELLTKDVFQAFKARNGHFDPPLNGRSIEDLQVTINGLQQTAITLQPDIESILNQLGNADGCTLARMTGSGAACFGLFETSEQAESASILFKNAVATTTLY